MISFSCSHTLTHQSVFIMNLALYLSYLLRNFCTVLSAGTAAIVCSGVGAQPCRLNFACGGRGLSGLGGRVVSKSLNN